MDPDTMRDMWDGRYRERGAVWGGEPNRFVVEVATDIEPGTALDLGCGQGRNALWLASLGFDVTGLDLSPVAVEQAGAGAEDRGVDATFGAATLVEGDPDGRGGDRVLLAYIHLPGELRKRGLATAGGAVAPGGRVIVIAHHLDNLGSGTGGPPNPDWLFTEAQLAGDFSSLDIVRNERVVRPTENGDALDVVCVAVN